MDSYNSIHYIFKALRYYTLKKCFLNVFIRDWKSVLSIHWRDWCWSWNSNILATWCKELTYWKRPWCWERLKAGGEGDDRGWDGWMASTSDEDEFELASGVGEGQGSLLCCSPWGRKESDTTGWLNWINIHYHM